MNDGNCGICLESIDEKTALNCGHSFCYECIWSWCQHNNVCPLCKASVIEWKTSCGHSFVCEPEKSYTEKIHEYLVYRDYADNGVEIPDPRLDPDLPGFVVPDGSFGYDDSLSEENDMHIYVKLTERDKQPVSTRTRAKTRGFL
jgi:Ring finger domain